MSSSFPTNGGGSLPKSYGTSPATTTLVAPMHHAQNESMMQNPSQLYHQVPASPLGLENQQRQQHLSPFTQPQHGYLPQQQHQQAQQQHQQSLYPPLHYAGGVLQQPQQPQHAATTAPTYHLPTSVSSPQLLGLLAVDTSFSAAPAPMAQLSAQFHHGHNTGNANVVPVSHSGRPTDFVISAARRSSVGNVPNDHYAHYADQSHLVYSKSPSMLQTTNVPPMTATSSSTNSVSEHSGSGGEIGVGGIGGDNSFQQPQQQQQQQIQHQHALDGSNNGSSSMTSNSTLYGTHISQSHQQPPQQQHPNATTATHQFPSSPRMVRHNSLHQNHSSDSTTFHPHPTHGATAPLMASSSRPSSIRNRAVSDGTALTAGNHSTTSRTSGGTNKTPPQQQQQQQHCSQCGVDVKAVGEQMEMARRKLELLQEKVDVDQALLGQEQKNFKRRLHAVKISVKKTQKEAALKERQRQLDWAELSKQTELATQQRIRVQQQEYESKLLETETQAQHDLARHQAAHEALQEHTASIQTQLDDALQECHAQEMRITQLKESLQQAQQSTSTAADRQATRQQQEQIEELERTLESKNMALESLEMQLLELERDRDASGAIRGSGGSTAAMSSVSASGGLLAGATTATAVAGDANVTTLNRQLSDAQLQIATLLNRQTVTDQKLSQERIRYDDLRQKMEQVELSASADREQNDHRLRLAKDVKDLQQQLDAAKSREQEHARHVKQMEQKVIQLQEQNEALETKLEDVHVINNALQEEVKLEKEKAEMALVMAVGTQRAVEDSAAPQVIDVLSGIPPDIANNGAKPPSGDHLTTATTATPTTFAASLDNNANRKDVMEYEWLGPQWSGVYTGQLSIVTNNPDGDGTLRVDDGAVYNGEWRNGKPHGSGVWATIEGDLFCSHTWSDGEKHGPTVDVLCDGSVYRGSYVHGKRHGHGVLTWPYGAHYTGQFDNDKRNGQGVYCYPDGRCYTGMYQDDRPHGPGVMKAVDGTVLYDGMWQLGEFLGAGGGQQQ